MVSASLKGSVDPLLLQARAGRPRRGVCTEFVSDDYTEQGVKTVVRDPPLSGTPGPGASLQARTRAQVIACRKDQPQGKVLIAIGQRSVDGLGCVLRRYEALLLGAVEGSVQAAAVSGFVLHELTFQPLLTPRRSGHDDIEDEIWIDPEILVHDDVAQASDCRPRASSPDFDELKRRANRRRRGRVAVVVAATGVVIAGCGIQTPHA